MVRGQAVELRAEIVQMGEVADADGAAADLVLIGRANATAGGADLARARRVLTQTVEVAVEGQDQRAGFRDLEIFGGDGDALPLQLCDLIAEVPGSSTTPLPITDSVPRTMPDGSSESL